MRRVRLAAQLIGATAAIGLTASACFLLDARPERPPGFGAAASDLDALEPTPDVDVTGPMDTDAEDTTRDSVALEDSEDATSPVDTEFPDIPGDTIEEESPATDPPVDSAPQDTSASEPLTCFDADVIGESCTCGGLGDAEWACDDDGDLVCTDANDTPLEAVSQGLLTESQMVSVESWLDSEDDVDWWRVDVTDLRGPELEPEIVRGPIDRTIVLELCVFYRNDDGRPIVPYECLGGSCAVYVGAADSVVEGSCLASPAFEDETDLYGCCVNGIGTHMEEIDAFDLDDSGIIYVRVRTQEEIPGGCLSYSLEVQP